ncbi:hypothetical protein [Neptunomonas japonica]|uniref:hypothetical protein n=1 Tax=Neptunomonas japonica TaxID=417574 RepID=UPI00041ED84C|nr:hypothetical protein [Neptunomonas japonica]
MNDITKELAIAEKYLSQMLEADRTSNYEAFIERFDKTDLEDFNEDVFLHDTKLMREDLGAYKSRSYMGSLKGFKVDQHPKCMRFVWRAIYDKNEALIVVGIHEKDGVWYVNESTVSK